MTHAGGEETERLESHGGPVAAIAHDLNNVLLVIGGHCELLLSQLPEHSALRPSLHEIREAYVKAVGFTRRLGSQLRADQGAALGGITARSGPARPSGRTRLLPPDPPRASQS